jgi:hypothetical protein
MNPHSTIAEAKLAFLAVVKTLLVLAILATVVALVDLTQVSRSPLVVASAPLVGGPPALR